MRKKIKHIIVFVCVLLTSQVFAQSQKEADSLQKALPHANDSNRIVALENLTNYYTYNAPKPDFDSALMYVAQLNGIAKKTNNTIAISRYYHLLGHINLQKKDYNNALDNFRQALKIDTVNVKDVDDSLRLALDYFDLALMFSNVNDIKKVGDYALDALNILEPLWKGQRRQYFEYLHSHGVNATFESITKEDGVNYMKAHPEDKVFAVYFSRAGSIIHRTFLAYGRLARIFGKVNDYDNMILYKKKQLQMARYAMNKEDEIGILEDITNAYYFKRDFKTVLQYNDTCQEMFLKENNIEEYINGISFEGFIYGEMGNYDEAIRYFKQADDSLHGRFEGRRMDNLGRWASVYIKQKKYKEGIEIYNGILPNSIKEHNLGRMAEAYNSLGQAYIGLGEGKQAISYLQKALDLYAAQPESPYWNNWETIYQDFSDAYKETGDYKNAYTYYIKYKTMEDSISGQKNTKAAAEVQKRYEVEQKDNEIDVINKAKTLQEKVAEADKRKQNIITWSILGGLLLVIVFSGFIFRSLRITRKQNDFISQQKAEVEQQKQLVEEKSRIVEEKNKDILDSITYAKRLQDAILPPMSIIEKYLPESFLLYKPKDIVAGDFYWLERTESTILIAAADCTGHGVPGAMVSVVCSNALNRTVKEFKITEPGKILDKTRELVLETFEKSESNVQDGMDISLASITPIANGVRLQWAGAYNSLWYIENGEMKELQADKQPIGKTDNPKSFITHTITLNSSAHTNSHTLYLFTDGYADQFGGPKGKKFKYKQLQEKLSIISSQPMAEQKKILEQTLESWQGELEQVDDILIIGIRV